MLQRGMRRTGFVLRDECPAAAALSKPVAAGASAATGFWCARHGHVSKGGKVPSAGSGAKHMDKDKGVRCEAESERSPRQTVDLPRFAPQSLQKPWARGLRPDFCFFVRVFFSCSWPPACSSRRIPGPACLPAVRSLVPGSFSDFPSCRRASRPVQDRCFARSAAVLHRHGSGTQARRRRMPVGSSAVL